MKAAFQDSASAFPSSQLITLTKEFTNMCKFDKSSSAPPFPQLICIICELNLCIYLCATYPMCKFCHILMRRDTKITKAVTFYWIPHVDTVCEFACDLTERSGVRLNIPLHMQVILISNEHNWNPTCTGKHLVIYAPYMIHVAGVFVHSSTSVLTELFPPCPTVFRG